MNPFPGWSKSVVTALVLSTAACDGGRTEAPEPRIVPLQVEWLAVRNIVESSPCDSVLIQHPEAVQALGGDRHLPMEVHDCQRLVVASAGNPRFGPLVGIFPVKQTVALGDPAAFAAPRPIADIYNWGDLNYAPEPYTPLAIGDGWSCLWLQFAGGIWRAGISPTPCLQSGAEPPDELPLEVIVQHTGGTALEYPHTARWGWDADSSRHYIGLKCALAWCAIGTPGLQPRPIPSSGGIARRIPGWFDEQHLGLPQAGGAPLVPGPWMAIRPSGELMNLRNNQTALRGRFAAGFGGSRIEMLTTNLADAGVYVNKFSLGMVGDTAVSEIFVRHGNQNMADSAAFNGPAGRRGAVLTYAGNPHAPSGAVRWRWYESDEKAWVPCVNGCCDIAPTGVAL